MTDRQDVSGSPLVSLLMVARDAEAYIAEALITATRQTYTNLEILVVDDHSTDQTRAIVRRHARRDPRIRLEKGDGEGLSAVRNRSIDLARGRYAAILDSDDILHPRHVETLLRELQLSDAMFASANMIVFSRGPRPTARPFATDKQFSAPRALSHLAFVEGGDAALDHPSYGTLKPMFDMNFVRDHQIRYDPSLRIGEDFDFVDQAFAAGASYRLVPDHTYFYRKHEGSVSHRMPQDDLRALIGAVRGSDNPKIDAASSARKETLEALVTHAEAVAALKKGDYVSAFKAIASRPQVAQTLAGSTAEGLKRRILGRSSSVSHRPSSSDRVALVLGKAETAQARDFVADLRAREWTVRERSPTDMNSAVDLSTLTAHVDLIVQLDDHGIEYAPFVLAPKARRIDLRRQQHQNSEASSERSVAARAGA